MANKSTFAEAITAYDEELVPRGRDEVKCSLENGFMLHDWEKVKESPVFRNGFRPMRGHDGVDGGDGNGNGRELSGKGEKFSEHAEVQIKREAEGEKRIEIVAN